MRRLAHTYLAAILVAIAATAILPGTSWAYFTTVGGGTAPAVVGSLPGPTITGAIPGTDTVALSWGAVTPPGSGSVDYYVSRDGGTPGGNCPASSAPSGATTCTDSGVSAGSHVYTVTAVWRTWASTGAPFSVEVTAGTATHFALSVSSTTPTAGSGVNLTITAKDPDGNTATGYSGSRNLTFAGASNSPNGTRPTVSSSSGTAVDFGTATPISFTNGVASVSGANNGVIRLYRAETASITVTDGSISNGGGLPVTVSPAAAASLSLAAASATPTAGAADNLTTSALDSFGNTATGYSGSRNLTFAGASNSPNGTRPTVSSSSGTAVVFGTATPISFTNGVASVSGANNGVIRLYRAETASITVTDGSISNGGGLSVTVSPAAAANLAYTKVTASRGSVSSTCLFTCSVTGLGNSGTIKANVSVTDSVGNTVIGLGSGHTVSVTATAGSISGGGLTIAATGPAESTTQFTFTAPGNGNYNVTITAAKSGGTTYTSATATASRA